MRTILASGLSLGLLLSLSVAANAATTHHHRRHAAVHSSQGVIVDTVPGYAYAPEETPRVYQPAPYSDQPSPYDNRFPNWGG
ncbi:hypothetical protein [Bradyrhizobium sp.]|uniref:hypothetical protein n=1 Tax=Bradyrhizobium sp. TaxID=376 RepID=UPI001DBBF0EF|nr:hypothetical protein [Bradyrhizobium sp.]MBV8698729.1 hypothetical protein [Bradyrhizobium sp.]MBV8916842.1 hypothetical protein [Bradyrhizobium sp.]MBV9982489.1 hypothetical protein [Bradyrhizobium sp.]